MSDPDRDLALSLLTEALRAGSVGGSAREVAAQRQATGERLARIEERQSGLTAATAATRAEVDALRAELMESRRLEREAVAAAVEKIKAQVSWESTNSQTIVNADLERQLRGMADSVSANGQRLEHLAEEVAPLLLAHQGAGWAAIFMRHGWKLIAGGFALAVTLLGLALRAGWIGS